MKERHLWHLGIESLSGSMFYLQLWVDYVVLSKTLGVFTEGLLVLKLVATTPYVMVFSPMSALKENWKCFPRSQTGKKAAWFKLACEYICKYSKAGCPACSNQELPRKRKGRGREGECGIVRVLSMELFWNSVNWHGKLRLQQTMVKPIILRTEWENYVFWGGIRMGFGNEFILKSLCNKSQYYNIQLKYSNI